MKKRKKTESIDSIQEELKKYDIAMSDEMRLDLEGSEKRQEKHTSRHLVQILLLIILAVGCVFYFAEKQEGNYVLTLYLDQDNLYKKGIDISESANFIYVGSHFHSDKFPDNMVTTESGIPASLHLENEGSQSGDGYLAYSFYIRNAGLEDSGYQATISLNSAFRHSEKALRVKVWRNEDVKTCEATAKSEETLYRHTERNFLQGYVDKYTVAVWIDRNDPDFLDEMKYGKPQLVMKIEALKDE